MTDDGPRSQFCGLCSMCHPAFPCRPDCHICWPATETADRAVKCNHQEAANA